MLKLTRGTGEAIATAVVMAINDWYPSNNVKAISFDTTACMQLGYANRRCCTHYSLSRNWENSYCTLPAVILGDVFNSLAGPSTGPDILLFKRFQIAWPTIVRNSIADGLSDVETATVSGNNKQLVDDSVSFAKECLKEGHSATRRLSRPP